MKTAEDEAFDDIERRQGGGFKAKQAMAADKLQEPVAWKETGEVECPVCRAKGFPWPKCGHITYLERTTPPTQEPEYEYLIDDLAEWKQYVEVDNAPYGLREHVIKVLLAHGIKEKNNG